VVLKIELSLKEKVTYKIKIVVITKIRDGTINELISIRPLVFLSNVKIVIIIKKNVPNHLEIP